MKLYVAACASLLGITAIAFPHAAASQSAPAPAATTPAAPAAAPVPDTQTMDLNADQLIWAYTPSPRRTTPRVPDDGTILHVPGSDVGYTRTQIGNGYAPPDWFPNSHPPAPKEVTEGRKPAYQGCALCHLPTGYGRPENEGINGLPVGYILGQIEDFKNDRRHRSIPRMGMNSMIPVAKGITPEEAKEAAEYFAAIKPVKWVKIVETATVRKTHPNAGQLVFDEDGATEPIGNRVVEVGENYEFVEMRDSMVPFLAFAPIGSFKKGETLVRTGGNGKTTACVMCHGQNLKGLGNIPPIAGRSPSVMARQLYDFKTGARNGINAPLMKGVVANLTDEDIVDLTAYLATLDQ